jgi:hypothetical protein
VAIARGPPARTTRQNHRRRRRALAHAASRCTAGRPGGLGCRANVE